MYAIVIMVKPILRTFLCYELFVIVVPHNFQTMAFDTVRNFSVLHKQYILIQNIA